MTRTLPCIAVALAALSSAHAQVPRVIEQIERSYELGLGEIVLPTSAVGSVIVKPCPECTNAIHRVDPSTAYLVNSTAVPLEEFIRTAEERRRAGGQTFVGVYYDIKTERVNRILLSYAAR